MTKHWISLMPYHLSSSLAAEKALSITRAMHRLGAQTNYRVSRVRFRFRNVRCLSHSASRRRFRQKRNNGVANWQCSAGAAGANAETVPAANKSAPRVSVRPSGYSGPSARVTADFAGRPADFLAARVEK